MYVSLYSHVYSINNNTLKEIKFQLSGRDYQDGQNNKTNYKIEFYILIHYLSLITHIGEMRKNPWMNALTYPSLNK